MLAKKLGQDLHSLILMGFDNEQDVGLEVFRGFFRLEHACRQDCCENEYCFCSHFFFLPNRSAE
jgi:hypothetical protein